MTTRDYTAQHAVSLPSLRSFEDRYGSLNDFRVADAVAASASYPLLGTVRLGDEFDRQGPGAIVTDGGLVDNSGSSRFLRTCWIVTSSSKQAAG